MALGNPARGHGRGHGWHGQGKRRRGGVWSWWAWATVVDMNTRTVKAHLARVGKALRRMDTEDTHFWEGIAVGSVVVALLTLLAGW